MMGRLSDLRVLYHLIFKRVRGASHADRLESFYGGQAQAYDDFRRRLLPGREQLYEAIPVPEGGVWIDVGGGTGANLEALGDRIHRLRRVLLVDLSPSLLEIARQRRDRLGWNNVEIVEADATTFSISDELADVVTFSYSLTMIPDWFAALDNARRLLRDGGYVGVVDFYVSRKFTASPRQQHGWMTRSFWPLWFGRDNVFLSPDHLPYLMDRFCPDQIDEGRAKIPYLPRVRVPYYRYIGRKAER